MFGTLARRLTAWYIFVAVAMVVVFAGGLVYAGLSLYAHNVNEQLASAAQQIPEIETRARAAHEDFPTGVAQLVVRLDRPGVIVRVVDPDGKPSQSGEFRTVRVSRTKAPVQVVSDPQRLDYFFGQAIGVHGSAVRFMGGIVRVSPDYSRITLVVELALLALLAASILAGFAAWASGRYITSQALRPLFDVTAALQRFAGRDFTAQSIDVAGRGEFNALAVAYNAAAAQVEQAFEERAQAESQIRQFVADAGHELRTPLTILLGYIDMLKRRAGDDDRSRRIFDTITIEGSRMRTLIDNLVLLAKLERDDVRPVEPFDLTSLLKDDIIEPRRVLAPSVRFDLDVAVDATIIGDRTEIYEAIANVVDNAIKYAPGSPISIAVRGATDSSAVEVSIRDRGPGIAPGDREAIFDRFYRGDLRGEIEGSGLGLAIAKRAVERAGGSLALLDGSPGTTTFVVRLRADQVWVREERPLSV
jgi:two-component system, OmpR family, sensor kinase